MLSWDVSSRGVVMWCGVIWDDNTPLFYFGWKLHSLVAWRFNL